MKIYKGAVFFVDILGIGALTRNKIELTELDYDAFKLVGNNRSTQVFCATLLISFRNILMNTKKGVSGIKVAQLSDCAFIWSEDLKSVLNAARIIMFESIRRGILCRGGLAFGEIIEPNKANHSLGHFILGEAATKAVEMESSGKGCRIFSDRELPSELSGPNRSLQYLFSSLKSPIDGKIVDEFKWYLPEDYQYFRSKTNIQKQKVACEILELITLLRYFDRFNWNASTSEGEIQLALSIEGISSVMSEILPTEDYCFSAEYLIKNLGSRKKGSEQRILKSLINEVNGLLELN